MAVLVDHFQKFHQNISLDDTRKERILSAHHSLRELLEKDGPIEQVLYETFLQGSYQHDTAIRPRKGEFDVDVVLSMDATDKNSWLPKKRKPADVIRWVADRLRQNLDPAYQHKVSQRTRCVRLNYAGEFHLDIVPAHCNGNTDDPLEVPDRDANDWIKSHPKDYTKWCSEQNKRTKGEFTRVVKMIKWWRNLKFDLQRAPKSIILETLIGKHMPNNLGSDAEAVVRTLESLHKWLSSQLCDFIMVPEISNPSLPEENLTRDWDLEDYKLFKKRIESAANKARQAYDEADPDKSIALWREIFGEDFPVSA